MALSVREAVMVSPLIRSGRICREDTAYPKGQKAVASPSPARDIASLIPRDLSPYGGEGNLSANPLSAIWERGLGRGGSCRSTRYFFTNRRKFSVLVKPP